MDQQQADVSTESGASLLDALSDLLSPLMAATDEGQLRALLERLGHLPAVAANPAVQQVIGKSAALAREVAEFDVAKLDSLDGIQELIQAAGSALSALRELDSVQIPELPGALSGIGSELATFLVSSYLRRAHPALFRVCAALTLIESRETTPLEPELAQSSGELLRMARARDQFKFSSVATLLRDPGSVLKSVYLPNGMATGADAAAGAEILFKQLAMLAQAFGLSSRVGTDAVTPPPVAAALSDEALGADHFSIDEGVLTQSQPPLPLSADFFDRSQPRFSLVLDTPLSGPGEGLSVDVLASSLKHPGAMAGYVIALAGTVDRTQAFGNWRLTTKALGQIPAFVFGPNGIDLAVGSATSEGELHVLLETVPAAGSTGPTLVVGSEQGNRLEVGALKFSTDLFFGAQRKAIEVGAATSSSAFVLAGGDGFIASLLPQDGLRVNFDLGLVLASDRGFHLQGNAGLEATVPVSVSMAGLTLSSLHVAVSAADSGVHAEMSGTIAASIGPVTAVIDRIGLEGSLGFPANGGNLGPGDLSLRFKSPSGVGVTVDAHGVVSGGGFLFHDEAQGLYAGALQLSLHEQLTLKAYGLIATRMPDGSAGYSLLIFITAEDFRPIQLGMGFTLLGIGGMVAINRTFDYGVLQQGLRNDTLATLLFPRDPVGNAPALIQALASAFPARRGSYLLGLLAKIGWFTPTLVMFDLALILEFGGRTRLLALGRVSARLPSADNDLVRLNLDALGQIDFDEETISIDASLVDSRLVQKFVISGAAALRAGFGSGPDSTFVLAMGGLHPHFAPPVNFPELKRLTMALSRGDNPRIVCESYFAITANTVQFGARASLYAAAAGFSIEGDIGYDVLIQLSPLHFIADFDARLQLKRGSSCLFMVEVGGQLEGPRPLRLSGKATFKIWFVHFSVRFDATLIDGELPPPPPAIDVFALLSTALLAPENWSTRNVGNAAHGIALRALPTTSGADLVVDPLGQLTIRQQVAPLNTAADLDVFGGSPISGFKRFNLTASSANAALDQEAVDAPFAPAQYFNMSDDEKLAAPSFEMMQAGAVFGSADLKFDQQPTSVVGALLSYRTVLVGEDAPAFAAPKLAVVPMPPVMAYTMTPQELRSFSRSGSVGRAALRRVARARFRNDAAPVPAAINPKRWSIIPRATGAAARLDPQVRSWSEYHAALKSLNRDAARWQLVPEYETEL